MGQHPAHIEKLLKKHINNTASPEELHELIAYFDTDGLILEKLLDEQWQQMVIDEEGLDSYTKRLLSERLDRIKGEIGKTARAEGRLRHRWIPRRAIAVAAVILLLFCAGTISYYIQTLVADYQATTGEDEILPGSNRARLILADGRTLELDGRKQGIIVGDNITYDDGTLLRYEKDALPEQVTLVVPRGGQYQAILPDGTRVWLNANSSLTYPVKFVGNARAVTLKGEAYFDVTHDRDRPFRVHLNGTEIEVLGTQFNANGYGAVTTTLIDGSVKVIHDNEQRLLKPGEEAAVRQSISVYPADIQKVMAWKNGFFYFKDDRITEILEQVARWYDVEVAYRQKSIIPSEGYTGKIRREANLSEVLEMLNYISGADFDINGREVTVVF